MAAVETLRAIAGRTWTAFAVSFALCFGVVVVWAMTTPMFGVPDEVSHMIRAAAAARGDIDGSPTTGDARTYKAPAILVPDADLPVEAPRGDLCYAGFSSRSPSCLVYTEGPDTQLISTAFAYPPLYYVLVGWPSRLGGLDVLYAMRVASGALFAAFVALAVTSLGRGPRWRATYVALAIAVTPMAWFLGGSVNPSSLAVATGLAAWCGGLQLVTSERTTSLAHAAWRFGLPLCVLLVVRRDSLLWGAIIVAGLAILVTRDRLRELLRSPYVLGWAAGTFVCAAYAWQLGGERAAGVAQEGGGSAAVAFGALHGYFVEMIGVLGWLDTSLPRPAYLLWQFALGGLLLATVAFGVPRVALACGAVVTAVCAAIVVIGAARYPYFQGRYGLPAAVGVPLLAGFAIATPRDAAWSKRPAAAVLATLYVVQVLAFYQHVRRNVISGETTWWVFGDATWLPPTAALGLLVGAHVVLVAMLLAWWFVAAAADDAPVPAEVAA